MFVGRNWLESYKERLAEEKLKEKVKELQEGYGRELEGGVLDG